MMLKDSLLIYCLLLFISLSIADQVAYYPLDDATMRGYPGRCFPRTNVQSILTTFNIGNQIVFDPGVVDGAARFPGNEMSITLGGWTIGAGAPPEGLTIAAWVFANVSAEVPCKLVAKEVQSGGGGTRYHWGLFLNSNRQLRFTAYINGGQVDVITDNNAYEYGEWFHFAGTYDNSTLRLYFNGLEIDHENRDGTISPEGTRAVILGDDNNDFVGALDEIRIFDTALTPAEIQALMALGPVDVLHAHPNVTILGEETQNASAIAIHPIEAVGANPPGVTAPLSYFWALVEQSGESSCGAVVIGDTNAAQTTISFGGTVGVFTYSVCATNGGGAAFDEVTIIPGPTAPEISSEPDPVVEIEEGDSEPLVVVADGYPPPTYQWQEFGVVEEVNPAKRSEHGPFIQGELRWVKVPSFAYYDSDYLLQLKRRINAHVDGDIPLSDHTILKRQATAAGWHPIPGATEAIWVVPPVSQSDDLKKVRCLVINEQGQASTGNITLRVVPPGDSSNTGSDVGAIVGSILGILLCCLCLCVVGTVIALLLLYRKGAIGSANKKKKLKPPKFEPLIYGGTSPQPYDLTEKQQKGLDDFEALLFEEDLILSVITTQTAALDDEEELKSMVWVSQAHKAGYDLLAELITREVEDSEERTLFRANSASCKFFSLWTRTFCLPYLWHTLVVPVNELNDNAVEHERGNARYEVSDRSDISTSGILDLGSMEVDPKKLGEDVSDTNINTLQLWLLAQKLFNAICASHSEVPEEVRMILQHVRTLSKDKYGSQAAFRAIGSFMFLRLICPSLLAPHQSGLLADAPHPIAQRQFLLLAKVLQNLANGTLPGNKEQFLERLNDFIMSNQEALRKFYANVTSSEGPVSPCEVPEEVQNHAVVVLYKNVYSRLDQIQDALGESEKGARVAKKLEEIVDSVGEPNTLSSSS